MKKAYLVTDGSYSDYHVVAVCTSRKLAEEIHTVVAADNDIEEYNLDQKLPKPPEGMEPWQVVMAEDGRVLTYRKVVLFGFKPKLAERFPTWDGSGSFRFQMWAKDQNHAIKIASERRAQLIALGKWEKGER